MLFSATMPGPIVALARQFLSQPVQIRAESDTQIPATEHVEQFAYRAHAMDKTEMLARILQINGRGLTLIFTRTKRTAQKVADELIERGFAAGAVHGDLGQGAREQALRAFRSGKVDVLVATDVAARGLDIDDVTHVINYQCPEDAMTYVHRIGRTARAGKSGVSVSLIDWDDLPKWKLICDTLDLPFHQPAETYSTSEHLYLELDIPREAKSVLPRTARTRAGLQAEQLEDLGGPDRKRPGRRSGESAGGRTGRGRIGDRQRTGSEAGDRTDSGTGERPAGGETGAPKRSRRRRRTRGGASAAADTASGQSASDSQSSPASRPTAG
jgi:superfamily II DNA/RNA helicase